MFEQRYELSWDNELIGRYLTQTAVITLIEAYMDKYGNEKIFNFTIKKENNDD